VSAELMSTSRLDRSSALPLWAQLEAELRRALDAGEFSDHFPTDLQLTRRYDVSRHTVREAVGRLQAEGLVTRVRGRGTVVETPEFEQRLGTLYSLFSSIESQGVEQRSEVVSVGLTFNEDVAARLGLSADTELFRLERIRFADDAPLAIDTAWLPAALGRPLLDTDFSHTALYDELEQRCGCRPDRGWERIAPVIPSAEERALLASGPDEAAFQVERLGQHGDEIVEWRVTLIRGDRYRFFADWSASGSGGLRLTSEEDE
jgi:GntR family transcriptional regulator